MTITPRLAFCHGRRDLAFLGLAVLGWGGFASSFSHPARIALAVATCLLVGAALFTRGNLSPGEREDRGNRWVLIAFGLIGMLSAYLPDYTDRYEIWTLDGGLCSLAWRFPLRRGRSAADLACFCAWLAIQRTGRHSARA
jgi:hypothetical protein